MSDVADTNEVETLEETQTAVPAAGNDGGPSIPKWRFDEVNNAHKETKQELQALRDLVNQRLAPQQQQRPQEPEVDFAQYGMDQDQGKAFMMLAKQAAKAEIAPELIKLRHQVAFQQTKLEEGEFLNTYGLDKASMLPAIREIRKQHAAQYGSFLPVETAFVLVQEQMRSRRAPAAQKGNAQAQAQMPTPTAHQPGVSDVANEGDYPGVNLTRNQVRPSAGGPAPAQARVAKSFAEMSIEEMEARLDDDLRAQGLSI
jgi:hypothetical protein